jgi:hypothetical protein
MYNACHTVFIFEREGIHDSIIMQSQVSQIVNIFAVKKSRWNNRAVQQACNISEVFKNYFIKERNIQQFSAA